MSRRPRRERESGAPKLRFKVGDRVRCARGIAIGSTGRIVRPVVERPANPLATKADWVVRFDAPVRVGSNDREELWFHDNELEPYTVHPDHRPESVGALQHPARRSP